MTIPSTSSSVTYLGNDADYTFSFPFNILSKDHLVVTHIDANENETVLVENTNYTVTWAGAGNSGSITRIRYVGITPENYPLADGESIRLERTVPLTQTTSFRNASSFRSTQVEAALDYALSVDQQQQRDIDDHEDRILYVEDHLPSGAPVSIAMQPVVASETLSEARANMGTTEEAIAMAIIYG